MQRMNSSGMRPMIANGPMPYGPIPNRPIQNGAIPNEPIPNGPIPYGPIPNGPMPYEPIPNGPIPNRPIPYGPIPNIFPSAMAHPRYQSHQFPARPAPQQNTPVISLI